MAKIENRQDLEAWLAGKPREVAVVLAVRVALRVLPLFRSWKPLKPGDRNSNSPVIFRAISAATRLWALVKYTEANKIILVAITNSLVANPFSSAPSVISNVSNAAFSASNTAITPNPAFAASSAAEYATASSMAFTEYANYGAAIWKSIESDASGIDAGIKPVKLADMALWQGRSLASPYLFVEAWTRFKSELLTADEDWDVWTDWYEARLAGKRPRWKDIEIFRVTLSDEAANATAKDIREKDWNAVLKVHEIDWGIGPTHVNALIKARIEGKAARSSKRPPEASATPTKPVAGSRSTEASRPQSTLAKAALANKVAILLQSKAIERVIDDRIAALESEAPRNDPDSIKTRETELEDLRKWKQTATDLLGSLLTLIETGDEQKLVANAKAIREAIAGLLGAGGTAVALDTTRAVVLAGFISTLCHLGLNLAEPMTGLAVAAGGAAIMGKSVVVEAFKAVFHAGKISDAKSD